MNDDQGVRPRQPDDQGVRPRQPDDQGAGSRRATVIAKGHNDFVTETRGADIVPDVVDVSRSHPLEPQHDSSATSSKVGDALTIWPALRFSLGLPRLGLLQDALPRVKVSPLLASFIACVLVPAFAAMIYFALIASDQFAARARFAVRQIDMGSSDSMASAENSASGPTGVNFSFTAPGQNAYIVTSYIQSRAIVDNLNKTLNLREIFRRPEADFWAVLSAMLRSTSSPITGKRWSARISTRRQVS